MQAPELSSARPLNPSPHTPDQPFIEHPREHPLEHPLEHPREHAQARKISEEDQQWLLEAAVLAAVFVIAVAMRSC